MSSQVADTVAHHATSETERDPLGDFIDGACRPDGKTGDDATPADLYDAYIDYCEKEGLTPLRRASMARCQHGLPRPQDGVAQPVRGFRADDLGRIVAPHLGEDAMHVPRASLLDVAQQRPRRRLVDAVKGDGHVGERFFQKRVGDGDGQGGAFGYVAGHENLNVLSPDARRMLRAGSRVAGAGRHPVYARLRRLAIELQQAALIGAWARARFARPAFHALRNDLPMAAAAVLWAVGFPLGLAVLMGAQL